tara:strand:+ start:418 stop:600 length:183 start_codon:yes stop_codon:yes gene_type:complete
MVSFARARAKSWLSRLWHVSENRTNDAPTELNRSKTLIEMQQEQNKCFLEASQNGGIWFS